MKKLFLLAAILATTMIVNGQNGEIIWGTGDWDADSLGNHRIVVQVEKPSEAVYCKVPWRRKDQNPASKEIWVFSARSGQKINNVIRKEINREFGELIFEPIDGAGEYYFYHLPYQTSGSRNYPTVKYVEPQDLADEGWKTKALKKKDLPSAKVAEIQSINDFHSFYPMEVIATADELKQLLSSHSDVNFMLFPEDRLYPIKMWTDIPQRWITRPYSLDFKGEMKINESYSFQVGLYASKKDIEDVQIGFSDMVSSDGNTIPSTSFSCYNKAGTDWTGDALYKVIEVKQGQIQALWMGLLVPEDAKPGLYKGKVFIFPKGDKPQNVNLEFRILPEFLDDRGDSQPELHSRLRWLDSRIGEDTEVVKPYTPIRVSGNKLNFLGRTLILSPTGLPEQIEGSFNSEMTAVGAKKTDLLYKEMTFLVTEKDGTKAVAKADGINILLEEPGLVKWQSIAKAGNLTITINGSLEADGFLGYDIQVSSSSKVQVNDISLIIPMNQNVAKYMLGLGRVGGYAPDEFKWKWDPYFNNDGPWIGDVNLGIQSSFRDLNYERPLNTNFYHQKPLVMPTSWYNDGKGGINLTKNEKDYTIQAWSGEREITQGDKLNFNVQFLITPFHAMDTKSHWKSRYYHRFEPIDSILAYGGNTINVHHATDINPYINYPFMTPDIMKIYCDEAHSKDAKVKFYYTVRELSNICPEIWALKSLGDEILSYGPGGGYSWLQEHLDGNYIAAWFVPEWKDAAVINSGVSRWHNYYLEGLNWLVKNVGFDGLYIDDVAFDRSIMKRVRKILKRENPGALIDLHSANQFNQRDGFANSANLYLEHFAYIDRLWFGEYFDYDAGPEYWLTEVSGIPFGLMGEMLQDGGNAWRGMLYGMTSRAPWSGDPSAIWKVWDNFGIEDSEMIGYWADDCPVKTGRPDILATVYKKPGKTMIAIASWAAGPARLDLEIDWESLGLNPEMVQMLIPEVKEFQEKSSLNVGESFQVPAGKGFLIILDSNDN